MKSIAFAPGHITGFFEPVYFKQDMMRTGSRGAGVNISMGAISEVEIKNSEKQVFEINVNSKKIDFPTVKLALKFLLGETKIHVKSNIRSDLAFGQGFGMSAASALSTTLAVSKLVDLPRDNALKASHFAEIQLKTGLGDVISSFFGGLEIRKQAGLPPWGVIEHIPAEGELVLCVIGKKVDTKNILNDEKLVSDISNYGKYCTKKILENPCIENFFNLSNFFTMKTNLANKKIRGVLDIVNKIGMGSMCMLGNSIFACGDSDKVARLLSSYGKVFVCSIDQSGACILKK